MIDKEGSYVAYLIIYLFICHSFSTVSAIIQNTIFTFTLDSEELEKYLFVTTMDAKKY